MVRIPGAEGTCWRSGREGTAAFIRREEGTRPCIKTEFTGRSQRRGRCVTGRVGPDLFVADSAPRRPRSEETALTKSLELPVVRCRGTWALGKFHLCQSPLSCSRIVIPFSKLWDKILALHERHSIWHQRSYTMEAV